MFSGFKTQADNTVEKMKGELEKIFEDLKGKVNSIVPGGVAGIQRMKGQNINDFSGYNQLVGQINQAKSSSFDRINGEIVKECSF